MPLTEPPLTVNGWLRYDVVARILDRLDGGRTVLEIGCGKGALGARLAERYEYLGLEPDQLAFETAKRRLGAGRVLNARPSDLAADARYDLVCAFEVLEHVDDRSALEEWAGLVRPGGTLLLSVPASPAYGASDGHVGHVRRYRRSELAEHLREAGLGNVETLLYDFPLGYLLKPIWDAGAARARSPGSHTDRTGASGRWFQPSPARGVATRLVSAPFRLVQRPCAGRWGTGIVATGHRLGP